MQLLLWKFMEFLKTESILPFANHCSRKICHRTMKEFLRSYITLLFWTTGLTKFQKKFDLINHTQFNLMYYSRHATGQRVCPWLNIREEECSTPYYPGLSSKILNHIEYIVEANSFKTRVSCLVILFPCFFHVNQSNLWDRF